MRGIEKNSKNLAGSEETRLKLLYKTRTCKMLKLPQFYSMELCQ